MNILLSKILKYELTVFEDYCSKRKELLEYLEKIEINKLGRSELLIFIDTLKGIIDPLKISTDCMENLLKNKLPGSHATGPHFSESQFIMFYLLFGRLFVSDSELKDDTDSESVSDPDSVSESV